MSLRKEPHLPQWADSPDDRENKLVPSGPTLGLAFASCVDLVVSGILVCVSFIHGYSNNSVLLCCLGLQASSHWVFSLLLLSRLLLEYWFREDRALLQRHRYWHVQLEINAHKLVGAVMLLVSGICFSLAMGENEDSFDRDVVWISKFLPIYGVSVYFLHTGFRVITLQHLDQTIIRNCFVVSFITLCGTLAIAVSVFHRIDVVGVFVTGISGLMIQHTGSLCVTRKQRGQCVFFEAIERI